MDKGNAVPSGGHDDIKEKLARERQEEYKQFMAEVSLYESFYGWIKNT